MNREEKGLNPQTIKEIDEALEELEAYKAKIEELKECCKTQILLNDEKFIEAVMPEKSAYYQGLSRGYQNMLDSLEKLEELDK